MKFDQPFRLGPFIVDRDGGLMPPHDRDARFTLRWRGCLMQAALRPLGDNPAHPDRVELQLQAVLGRVPSSAEATAPQRDAVLAVLRDMAGHEDGALRLGLSADHRLVMHEQRELAVPVTGRALIAEVANFVLEVAPYLDLAAESGATGTAKI